MKKLLLLGLLFFILILRPSFAQEASGSASSDSTQKTEYQLPYPGLLPDSPLYGLKTLRDRMVGFLISDPLKKAEFDLLQADKRLVAGMDLIEKEPRKIDLAISTISKAENYLEKSLEKIKSINKEGIEAKDFLARLQTASKKHGELLEDESKKIKNKELLNIAKRVQKIETEVDELMLKK